MASAEGEPGVSTRVIAEAGVNHDGDIDVALRMIDAAAQAGANFVKFQTFRADQVATRSAAKARYQSQSTGAGESQYEMLRRLELTREMHEILIARARARGIAFLSTPFDVPSVDLLVDLGLDVLKVPSGEITNVPYLRHVGGCGASVILSTGMATLDEVAAALATLEAAGTPRRRITVLHCTTAYPADIRDVNLRAMVSMRDAFDVAVGYSDHTIGIEVPMAAVALGATVIEKHFTLDRSRPGPDHQASLEPRELEAMIQSIRRVEQALGDGIKRPSPGEIENLSAARRAIVAAVAIRAGERFSPDNVTTKRAGAGMSSARWDEILGRTAPRDFAVDECIEL
jgi:N,N'-diacetyllegionaminate synthase